MVSGSPLCVTSASIPAELVRKHCMEMYKVSNIMQSRSSFAYNCCTSNCFSHNTKCYFSWSRFTKPKHLRGFLSNLNFSFLLSNGGSVSLKKITYSQFTLQIKLKLYFWQSRDHIRCCLVFYMSALSDVWINTPGISSY